MLQFVSADRSQDSAVRAFLAHFLFLLAAWTLTIKYIFPLTMAAASGEPAMTYVMWDFWWVAHIWLGWALLNWQRYTYALALAVSVVEIVIVVAKFVLFLRAPLWDIWHTNWFINKIFVLSCFFLMLGWLVLRKRANPRMAATGAPTGAPTGATH